MQPPQHRPDQQQGNHPHAIVGTRRCVGSVYAAFGPIFGFHDLVVVLLTERNRDQVGKIVGAPPENEPDVKDNHAQGRQPEDETVRHGRKA